MKIDKKRFVLRRIGNGEKAHIFPKNHLSKALCLRGPADEAGQITDEVCRDCAREYPVVEKSPSFAIFVG